MEHFRSMYKSNSLLSPNRWRAEAKGIRAQKRKELYTSTRNISPSPTLGKENSEGQPKPEAGDAKLNRQKAYVLKYLQWKTEKAKQAEIKEKSKRAPFITSARSCPTSDKLLHNTKKSSFAPANHIFRPPSSLQDHELKVMGSNRVGLVNGPLKEVFHFVPTPKKKNNKLPASELLKTSKANQIQSRSASKFVTAQPAAISNVPPPREATKKVALATPMPASKAAKAQPVAISNVPPPREATKKVALATPLPVSKFVPAQPVAVSNVPQAREAIKKVPLVTPIPASKAAKGQPVASSKVQPPRECSKKMPLVTQKPIQVPLPNKPSVQTAVSRTRSTVTSKTMAMKNSTKASPRKHNFTKPKSTVPPVKRPTFKAAKKTNSSISNALANIAGASKKGKQTATLVLKSMATGTKLAKANQVPETPNDPNQDFAFFNVVTSTKRKSISNKESTNANSLLAEMDKLASPVDESGANKPGKEIFNFLRYSVIKSDEKKPEIQATTEASEEVVHVTPDKSVAAQAPTVYLSPYVSVSRGKVGVRVEREKRNSIYMSLDKSTVVDDPDTTAKVRHTLATVHYYRKQLTDEIARLNEQCDNWQQYKDANADLVEDTGSDMINVTIGQTKLLTTKKLKQFGDLIDRCEDGVMGKKSLAKGEGAKPILPEDLEGFWSMVGLQIENVDKRFANLQRWKENNWKDPDEVPPKQVKPKGIAKKLKNRTTAAPNKDLQKILRNAQAAFLRNRTANTGPEEEDVILTPSKSRQVLIRDRRSRSAAATYITITPKASRRSSKGDQTTPTGDPELKLLPHINGFRKSMNLLKSTLLNKADKKSPAVTECTSPLPASRKSILKTPGSIRRAKSVVFNSPTLRFTMEDRVDDGPNSSKETPRTSGKGQNEDERRYSLRNRKIKLRDSSEFTIPQ